MRRRRSGATHEGVAHSMWREAEENAVRRKKEQVALVAVVDDVA